MRCYSLSRGNAITITVQGTAPSVQTAYYTPDLCRIVVEFDMNIQTDTEEDCLPVNRDTCCSVVFDSSTAAKLGTGKDLVIHTFDYTPSTFQNEF